jgi:hypothetical protein
MLAAIAASVSAQSSLTGNPNITATLGDSTTSTFRILNSSSELMRIQANGRVGINSVTPQSTLHVGGAYAHVLAGPVTTDFIGATQTAYGMGNGTEQAFFGVQSSLGFFGTYSQTPIGFVTGNYTRAFLTPAGQFSINNGIATPMSNLDVFGNAAIGSYAGTAAPPANSLIVSGKVGIGTASPSTQLQVAGSSLLNGIYAGYNDAVSLGNATNGQMVHFGGPNTTADLILAAYAPFGNVGVGTQTPVAKLQVAGDLRIGSNGVNTDLKLFTDATGVINGVTYDQVNSIMPVTIPASGITHTALHLKSAVGGGTNQVDLIVDGSINAKFQDVAEWVPVTQQVLSGMVMVVSGTAKNTVSPSSVPYDTRVAGVVSAQPGLLLGESSPTKAKIATTGRVKVRVDASKAPIEMGDLLVTSAVSGLAMKSEPLDLGGVKIHRPGTLIGKALEPLAGGQGEILVLLSLQ